MARLGNAAPIVIKRRKVVVSGGHHGGAWKVAYADFVTAMMAFFLLMWLLNATTDKQRKGIADYFSPVIPVHRTSGGGEGMFGGDSMFTDELQIRSGTGASGWQAAQQGTAAGPAELAGHEQKVLEDLQMRLAGIGGESPERQRLLRHLVTRLTDEGLVVELFDQPGSGLFTEESDRAAALFGDLVAVVADSFAMAKNPVAVQGHVRSYPITLISNPAWPLSVARAQVARVALEDAGFDPQRLRRVTGYGDRRPANADPMLVRNNRIEFILLRGSG